MLTIDVFNQPDTQDVQAALAELQEFERRLSPDRKRGQDIAAEYLEYLLKKCKSHDGELLVARIDQSMAGCIAYWVRKNEPPVLETYQTYLWVSDLVVLGHYRRTGLGKLLLEKANAHAKKHECACLRVRALAANVEARAFYGKVGFSEYEVEFIKKIFRT